MGVKQATDIAQHTMEYTLRDIEKINEYMDDVGCFSNGWPSKSKCILNRLQEICCTINQSK
jgi:hypothetical protein